MLTMAWLMCLQRKWRKRVRSIGLTRRNSRPLHRPATHTTRASVIRTGCGSSAARAREAPTFRGVYYGHGIRFPTHLPKVPFPPCLNDVGLKIVMRVKREFGMSGADPFQRAVRQRDMARGFSSICAACLPRAVRSIRYGYTCRTSWARRKSCRRFPSRRLHFLNSTPNRRPFAQATVASRTNNGSSPSGR